VVLEGELLDGLAGAVSRADSVGGSRARCALASGAFVSRETVTGAGRAIAQTLVGALTVSVCTIRHHNVIRILHTGVLLVGAMGVHVTALGDEVQILSSRSTVIPGVSGAASKDTS